MAAVSYCGIDPGAEGALALLGEPPTWAPMDTAAGEQLAPALRALKAAHPALLVGIERVSSYPGMGCAGAFRFGGSFYAPQAACAALEIPYVLVGPKDWQRGMALPTGKDCQAERKEAIVAQAMARWPGVGWPKAKKARSAVADALYIALYVQRTEQPVRAAGGVA